MKMNFFKVGAAVLFFILILIVLWAVEGRKEHDFNEEQCSLCHVGLKDPSVLTREPDHLCLSCHPDNDKRSHPSDFVPTQELPPQYPLYRGKMVCITCHFPHPHFTGGDGEGPGPYMLRSKSVGKVFCFSCHRGGFTDESIDSHALAVKKAHTGGTLDFDQKGVIDDNSRDCLSCHDGTLSSATHTQIAGISFQHGKSIGMSHPISVDYEEVYLKYPKKYFPPASLDPRIILVNGKIGCKTCHDHYSKYKDHLVMDNFKSKLCLSCHNL